MRPAPLSVDPALVPTMPLEHWLELKARLRAAHESLHAPTSSRALVNALVLAILVTVLACIAVGTL